jgi:benzoate-CoA ligase
VCASYGKEILGITERDVCYATSKMFFAYGLGASVYLPLASGATVIVSPEPFSPARTWGILTGENPSLFFAVPSVYRALVDATPEDARDALSSVRIAVSAGESLPEALFDAWRRRFGVEILDGIGSTEMLHIFICNLPGKARGGTSGTIVPGYKAKIVDDAGLELGAGETGNLWVSGDSCCAFYWNKHEKSKATFRGEWTVTGDKYHLDVDGYYTYEGRADDMLKVSGQWVSPAEVEAALMEHAAVLECGVVGAKDKDELTKPRAFVLLKQGREPSDALAEELKQFVKTRIAPYKYPRWIEFVDELPKTATGKIQRFKLRELGGT